MFFFQNSIPAPLLETPMHVCKSRKEHAMCLCMQFPYTVQEIAKKSACYTCIENSSCRPMAKFEFRDRGEREEREREREREERERNGRKNSARGSVETLRKTRTAQQHIIALQTKSEIRKKKKFI